MQTLDWQFSNAQWISSFAFSIGLTAAATGVPFSIKSQHAYSDEVVDSSTGFVWSTTVAPAPRMTTGYVLAVFVVSGPSNPSNPALVNVKVRYGGVELNGLDVTQGQRLSTTENHVFSVIVGAYVGDLSDFDGALLELDISSVYGSGTANVAGSIIFVEGVLANATGTLVTDGAADTFASPLTFDADPSIEFNIVLSGAMAARLSSSDSGTITIESTGFAQADDTASINAGLVTLAWLMSCDTSYNCECEVDPEARTLLELRTDLLPLAGYAAQLVNPPPGIANLMNLYIRQAQNYLYTKYKALETERFFSWTLTPGIRYYGLRDNRNCCDVALNKYRITGAWLQDLNNVWWPLIEGIDPTFYTLNVNFGWPAYYQVRQCIEIFPAPQAAYTLWLRGHFNLLPLTEDTDVTTIAADPVLNYATFLAKSAKGMADAPIYSKMAAEQIGYLISGAHGTRRYIPGTSEIPVPTPPVMVHFDA